MYYFKKLIFLIVCFGILISRQKNFRGLSKGEIQSNKVPISFSHYISSNYDLLPQQINPSRGSYLIIARDGLVQQGYIDFFSAFKKSQGFDVNIIAITDSELNVESIQNYITTQYNDDPMLEYVLLIGDVDGFSEIPSYYYGPENDVTDQKYTQIVGNDFIPDVFIGRISIDSAYEFVVIALKTINYARDPLAYNQYWLDKALVVAGNYANTPPIPITPKWTSSWLRDELLDYGYSTVDTVFYPPIQQGAPYISEIINNGVGLVNYRGWGDANGWHYPEFHVDDVNDGLNNGWMTPVFMSYVCNSNDFANSVDPCFSEAILRGGTTSNPKGGVAFIGPSDLHTSTKYNNVINAYMYDAMINHNVLELGPALMAGQSGLFKEFPNQNEPGEAQEFYFHVYNILGDPSIQVYLDTPDQFIITTNSLSEKDGFIRARVLSSSGDPVDNSVIAIMHDDTLLSKGITSKDGVYSDNINLDGIASVSVYANKGGYIQGLKEVTVEQNSSSLVLNNTTINTQLGHNVVSFGNYANITFQIINVSNAPITSFDATIDFSGSISTEIIDITIPQLNSLDTISVTTPNFLIISENGSHHIDGHLDDQNNNTGFNFSLDVIPITMGIEFSGDSFIPSQTFESSLFINNYSNAKYSNVSIIVESLNEITSVIHNGDETLIYNIEPFESAEYATNFFINSNQVSYGSTLSFLIHLTNSDSIFYTKEVEISIEPETTNYPVSPSGYGYWMYDDLDIDFTQSPTFNWIELDPSYGGENATEYLLDDDDHVNIDLPFEVQYHGEIYDKMTISSNGWASFVTCDIDYFWNMSIPSFMSPKAMLAPFWDDLEVVGQDSIRVYTYNDVDNHRFVIEWSRSLNGYDELTEETFEIIIYDSIAMATMSGDNVIDFQYLEIDDVDVTKNYSTVGIQSQKNNDGQNIIFNNNYAPGAADLENGRVYRFTTEAPENYISPLSLDLGFIPNGFSVSSVYPNPFNPKVYFTITTSVTKNMNIYIVDILGRKIADIYHGIILSGEYKFSWDGTNMSNSQVSSGNYFLVVKSGESNIVNKILYLK